MKFLSKRKAAFGIELTPLIDIVFLLVIFFVVTAKIQGNQYIDLELPTTDNFKQGKNRKSTRLNSSHSQQSRMPSSA